ncbi:MAG: serine/threonine-protein kinase, partial [Myxococcota bacterium]|nr:serine/threonine-protein kinase [Myxococcota bacterium]
MLEPPLGSALERETFDRMFLQEAATAAQLKSPHSITLYDFGQADDETLFLVMEFLEGRPLDQVLAEDAPLSARRAVHIAVQTCRSLREAHEKGLVHRDLKPANVMLVDRNNDPDFVKVLDFGIAKNRGAAGEDDEASLAGVFIGSPRYASPEQLQRRPDVDHRADIYACGLLIYALLVGEPPFDGTSRELLHKHLLEPPQPMDERNIDVPPSLAAVVYRCLEKDPAQRFADMTELIRALGGVTYTDGEQEPTTTDADMADFAAEIDLDETDDALLALRREQERRKRQLLISDQAAAEEITDEFAAAAHDSSTTQDIEAAPRRALWPWLLGALVVLALLS